MTPSQHECEESGMKLTGTKAVLCWKNMEEGIWGLLPREAVSHVSLSHGQ